MVSTEDTQGRLNSGIEGLDAVIEGGFKEGTINLVCGSAGAGKTIFGIQFLMEGLKNGETAIFISFEETKAKIYGDVFDFGWDLAEYESNGQLKFLEYTPEQVKRVIVEGGGTLDAIISQSGAKRIVIDSISSFAMLFQDAFSKKESSLALFELINRWGCTAVLTSDVIHISPNDHGAQLQFEADSVIVLYHFKKKGVRERGLEVLKMRGTKTPETTMYMDITEKGIEIDPKVVVSTD